MADLAPRIAGILEAAKLEAGFAAVGVESGKIIAVNADALFPTASVFKVPVMAEVYAQTRAGRFALSDRLPFAEAHRIIGSGVMQTLGAGIAPSIRDLMMLMMIVSDNTATDILCDLIGPGAATARMQTLGLTNIHVPLACHGLFRQGWNLGLTTELAYADFKAASKATPMDFTSDAFARTPATNTSSARDMAALMALIATNQAGHPDDCADMIALMDNQHYQDRVPRFLPTGSTANKTGSLRGLRNDAGLIRRGAGDTIAFALFTFDGTELPHGNSRALQDANVRIGSAMGEVGALLWDEFK